VAVNVAKVLFTVEMSEHNNIVVAALELQEREQ